MSGFAAVFHLNGAPVDRAWLETMADGMYMKPPGIVWIGQFFVPLKAIFGSVEAALLFSIVLTQFVLLILIFRIGEELSPHSRSVAAAGVVLAAGAQLFVGLTHQFFVEPLQAVAVAWILLITLRASYWCRHPETARNAEGLPIRRCCDPGSAPPRAR